MAVRGKSQKSRLRTTRRVWCCAAKVVIGRLFLSLGSVAQKVSPSAAQKRSEPQRAVVEKRYFWQRDNRRHQQLAIARKGETALSAQEQMNEEPWLLRILTAREQNWQGFRKYTLVHCALVRHFRGLSFEIPLLTSCLEISQNYCWRSRTHPIDSRARAHKVSGCSHSCGGPGEIAKCLPESCWSVAPQASHHERP